ncbi:hypothetical protein ZEAMMB73_Zm00001d052048 [Zea mays]|uniref:HAT C-terminal dimerisation domain-containing protein n=1 Tax=Zea mays TaxID=4577 RepID=A0A1D6QCC9_MAIZE|nr:hypothetical protein ZEAMMB73_Zm00001d052048 [Zea mays]
MWLTLTRIMLEALVCTQDWLRRTTPINIQENMEELAMIEADLIEEFGGKGKQNPTTSKSQATPSSSRCPPSKSVKDLLLKPCRATKSVICDLQATTVQNETEDQNL